MKQAAFLLCICAAGPLRAQDLRLPVASAAEVAIARGRLGEAESILFEESAHAAREPSVRGALGMFLASRGRLKVGTVLLEEARQFGGDGAVIDVRLARIYRWLGDWPALAALKRTGISSAEGDRARWLAEHAPARLGADSATVPLEPNDVAGFGRVALAIGGTTVLVDVTPAVDGLVLPSTPAISGQAQQFGMQDTMSVAVIFSVGVGAIRLTNVPARLSPGAQPSIGFDVLASLTPTFDASAHTLTLRQRPPVIVGDTLPFLLSFPGVRLVARPEQPPVAMESPAGRAALRSGPRWTFDLKKGAIVVHQ